MKNTQLLIVVFIAITVIGAMILHAHTQTGRPSASKASTQTALGATFVIEAVRRHTDGTVAVRLRLPAKGRDGLPVYVNRADLIWKDKHIQAGLQVKEDKARLGSQLAELTFRGLPRTVQTMNFSVEVWLKDFREATFEFPHVRPEDLPVTKTVGSTSMTLTQIYLNQSLPAGEWNDCIRVNGTESSPAQAWVSVEFDTRYLEGHVDDLGIRLTDDRGVRHEAIKVMIDSESSDHEVKRLLTPKPTVPDTVIGSVRPNETHAPLAPRTHVIHKKNLFVFKEISPMPAWLSVTRYGLVPPDETGRATVVFRGIPIP